MKYPQTRNQRKDLKPFVQIACLVAALVLIQGCAMNSGYQAVGVPFAPIAVPDSKARIVVCWPRMVRPTGDPSLDLHIPSILIGGKAVGDLDSMGYVDAVVEPGEVTISARVADPQWLAPRFATLITNVAGGDECYAIYEGRSRSGFFERPSLRIVGLAEGREAALKTRSVNPDVELSGASSQPLSPVSTKLDEKGIGTNTQTGIRLSALGQRFRPGNPDLNNGRIVVYSVRDTGPGSVIQPTVIIAGKEAGILDPSGFVELEVPPGEPLVAARWNRLQTIVKVQVGPGSEAFVRFRPKGGANLLNPLQLEVVANEVGSKEALNTRLSRPVAETLLPQDTNQFAIVSFVRTLNLLSRANVFPAEVFINGVSAGSANKIGPNGMIIFKVPPGETTAAVRWEGGVLILRGIAGQEGRVPLNQSSTNFIALAGEQYDFEVVPAGVDVLTGSSTPTFHLRAAKPEKPAKTGGKDTTGNPNP